MKYVFNLEIKDVVTTFYPDGDDPEQEVVSRTFLFRTQAAAEEAKQSIMARFYAVNPETVVEDYVEYHSCKSCTVRHCLRITVKRQQVFKNADVVNPDDVIAGR